MRGLVWVVGAIEDECNAVQSSGCLLFTRPRAAPHCAFVVSHLEIITVAKTPFHQKPVNQPVNQYLRGRYVNAAILKTKKNCEDLTVCE